MTLKGKRLLVLGGTSASYDLVKIAKSMGIYVIVTDDSSQITSAKFLADEVANISTADIPGLVGLVKEKSIDGAFCGPSEFNIRNLVKLCKEADLPCYCTPEQWEMCSNKKTFKKYCVRNNVPTAEEYRIDSFTTENGDNNVEYPVIVKPVDGCSSKGISICNNRTEVLKAYELALSSSASGNAIIEQYIDNGGSIFSFRYILDDGNCYPYLAFDTYIVDPVERKYLISAFTYFPSKHIDILKKNLDADVRRMFKDMGLKNGTAFIQSIPYRNKIYCHEMGYRLSGGMIYKITESLMRINDMKMMIRFALGESIISSDEIQRIQTVTSNKPIAQLMIPLNCGTIKSIDGLEEIRNLKGVDDFLQYYRVGDTIEKCHLGTLAQHFGRFTLSAEDKDSMVALVNQIQDLLRITDTDGNNMYTLLFDTARLY